MGPEPREKPKIKSQAKTEDDDWYEAAVKLFSISLNRSGRQRDPLATLMSPIKSRLKWNF